MPFIDALQIEFGITDSLEQFKRAKRAHWNVPGMPVANGNQDSYGGAEKRDQCLIFCLAESWDRKHQKVNQIDPNWMMEGI